MKVLRNLSDLSNFIHTSSARIGCLADTGFLYGLAYDDDRLFSAATDLHDLLSELKLPIYANVISRMELIDLVFRKQVTSGCIKIFNGITADSYHKPIYKILKDIRDKSTASLKKNESYKIDEHRLKKLRKNIDFDYGITDWLDFCKQYVGTMLPNELKTLEEEFGLNFVEVMEGQTSPLFERPLSWQEMIEIMGKYGHRAPDAMIINLFMKSRFPLLITSDSDFEYCFSDPLQDYRNKAIFLLEVR